MGVRIFTAVAGAFAIWSVAAGENVKLVATGWDVVGITPEDILANADRIDRTGYDGVTFWFDRIETQIGKVLGSCENPATDGRWLRSSLERHLPAIQEAVRHPSLSYSFVQFLYQPKKRLDWRDDAAWSAFAHNLRELARVAKTGGLKGFFIDTEEYWRTFQYVHAKADPPFAETSALARKRGAEVFRGVFEEFPGIVINTTWWLSAMHEYMSSRDIVAEARGLDDLLPAFTDGILDVMPLTARFLDGNEHMYSGALDLNYVTQRRDHQMLVSPENRAKFRACFGPSSGFYLDMYVNPARRADGSPHPFYAGPVGGSRLNAFIDRLDKAICNSEEFIWIFGERGRIVDWQGTHPRYPDAAEVYTNSLWNARLPGLDEEMRIVKSPRAALLPRLKHLKASGKAMNLAGAIKDEGGGFSYNVDVGDVKYGEWYAVTVEMKCAFPSAWIYPMHGGEHLWDQRLEHVVFAPQSDKGDVRRGVGFIRIRGATNAIRVRVTYNRYVRTKPEDVKIAVYRVYAPGEDVLMRPGEAR